MSEYQICTRCVMDNRSDPTITFDNRGRCSYCREAEPIVNGRAKPEGDTALRAIFEKIKQECKSQPYDCLVGVSGGLDSSYILYLGHKYGLRMLGFHLDDGLDTPLAKENIRKLCERTDLTLINIQPDLEQYRDLTLSFFKASVPNLAIPQDNLILAAQIDVAKKYHMKYLLNGINLAMESITFAGSKSVAADLQHIRAIQREFSSKPIDKLRLTNSFESIFLKKFRKDITVVKPLNMIDYRMDVALQDLKNFCDYEYYGGKHHESVLCRFMQCWYLPEKFGIDKRKAHLSSLIISGQMPRNEALSILAKPGYPSEELLEVDKVALSEFFNISRQEFDRILAQPPRYHQEFPQSFFATKLLPFILHCRNIIRK